MVFPMGIREFAFTKKHQQMGASDKTVQKKIGIVGLLPAMLISFLKFLEKKVKLD